MNARSLARPLVIVALACGGLFLAAQSASAQDATPAPEQTTPRQQGGTVVQNDNGSVGSVAASAPVVGGNQATTSSGPSAAAGGSASMIGDTHTGLSQDSTASGSPVSAGSQTTDASGGAVVQNSNRTAGAAAIGQPVVSFNSASAHNGPAAFGPGARGAMVGDGNLVVDQVSDAEGGPADAGSQFTLGRGGAVVQNTSDCGNAVTSCGLALAGPVLSANVLGAPGVPVSSGAGPVAVSLGGFGSSARLVGDADAVYTQQAVGLSGAAGVGFQDTVAGGGVVQNQSRTARGVAASGPVSSTNIGFATAGPSAFGLIGADAAQFGDVSGDLDMVSQGASGDALTGSQTTGSVGDLAGALTTQNRMSSEDDTAVTGMANAGNVVTATAGPAATGIFIPGSAAQLGDARFHEEVVATAVSGDALAGSQDTQGAGGVVQNDGASALNLAASGPSVATNGVTATAGPQGREGSARLAGDAITASRGDALSLSGDALAGSQRANALGGVIQDRNRAALTFAISGPSVAASSANVSAGPVGLLGGSASQFGNALSEVNFIARGTSGDAVSGSQVTDGGSSQKDNAALLAFAVTAPSLAVNLPTIAAGPTAIGPGSTAALAGDAIAQTTLDADAQSGPSFAGSQVGTGFGTSQGSNTALGALAGCAACPVAAINVTNAFIGPFALLGSAVQSGNAQLQGTPGQQSAAHGGASIAGSQIGSGFGLSQNENNALGVVGAAGPAVFLSVLGAGFPTFVGPVGIGDSAALAGDAILGVGQDGIAFSGDAIAGSQVSGGGFGQPFGGLGSPFGGLGSPFGGFGSPFGSPFGTGSGSPFGTTPGSGLGGLGGLGGFGGLGAPGLGGLGGGLTPGLGGLGGLGGAAQQQNDAAFAVALSGPAFGFDIGTGFIGPVNSVQFGTAFEDFGQTAIVGSGPASAGSQVSGGGFGSPLGGLGSPFGGLGSPFGTGFGSPTGGLGGAGLTPGFGGTGTGFGSPLCTGFGTPTGTGFGSPLGFGSPTGTGFGAPIGGFGSPTGGLGSSLGAPTAGFGSPTGNTGTFFEVGSGTPLGGFGSFGFGTPLGGFGVF